MQIPIARETLGRHHDELYSKANDGSRNALSFIKPQVNVRANRAIVAFYDTDTRHRVILREWHNRHAIMPMPVVGILCHRAQSVKFNAESQRLLMSGGPTVPPGYDNRV